MNLTALRKVLALTIALFAVGGSLASAGGAKNFGECVPGGVTVDGGAKNFGE